MLSAQYSSRQPRPPTGEEELPDNGARALTPIAARPGAHTSVRVARRSADLLTKTRECKRLTQLQVSEQYCPRLI